MIKLSCQQCSKAFGAPDDAAGKNIRCPHCQAVNKIPAAQSADASDAPASAAPAAVNISVSTSESAVRRPYSRRKRSPLPLILAGVAVVIVGGVVVFALTRGGSDEPDENIADNKPSENKPAQPDDTKPVAKPNLPPTLDPIRSATVKAGDTLAFQARGTDPDGAGALIYSLADDAPDGAAIHPGTGQFTWTPGKEQYGQSFQFSVRVQEPGDAGLSASQPLVVQVASPERPIDRLLAALRARGANAELLAEASSAPFSGDCQIVSVDDDQVAAYQYDSRESVAADAAQVAPDMKTMFGQPRVWTEPVRLYQTDALLVMYTGDNASTIARLDAQLGTPFATASASSGVAEPGPDFTPVPPPKLAVVQVLLDLHEQKNLFKPSEYPTIRRAFAEQFQADQEPKIKAAYGDQYDAMTAWLDEHAELKEEFYNAIDPTNDDVAAVLGLFAGLKDQFPDKIAPYGNLAIATAVTWDNPRGVYDYSRHAQRTRSTMPDELADAVANFQYFLEAEQFMQGRGQFLPWEFLLHMINHKTPRDEREWSLANYLTRRVMFGKIYSDVPYDDEMLRTQSQVCRLADKAYILPNILQFGGVCAMQADFAARVGKSIGVPAEYVRGESIYGDLHAWVLWVELTSVTKGSIGFRIESHGRYRGDKYYVGTLTDPQTGQQMTDRQLELRLHTVGVNTAAKRHADLVMRSYPALREELQLDIAGQLAFLEQVIKLCPWNVSAWTWLASISKSEELDAKQQKQMLAVLSGLFDSFAVFPDFTWTLFDDLIAFEKVPQKRNQLYARLLTLYVSAQRPDLACEARLKLTDHLVNDEKSLDAINGLAATIMAFPDEGRYVPRMLDRLEQLCVGVKGADEELLKFYASFLPVIPQKRGNDPSKYCMEMFERGIAKFKEFGQPQLAAIYEAQLAKIRAGSG